MPPKVAPRSVKPTEPSSSKPALANPEMKDKCASEKPTKEKGTLEKPTNQKMKANGNGAGRHRENPPVTIEILVFCILPLSQVCTQSHNLRRMLRLELALVFLEEEMVMQQSSVSISLSF